MASMANIDRSLQICRGWLLPMLRADVNQSDPLHPTSKPVTQSKR
jgi:hypothetical protein